MVTGLCTEFCYINIREVYDLFSISYILFSLNLQTKTILRIFLYQALQVLFVWSDAIECNVPNRTNLCIKCWKSKHQSKKSKNKAR